MLEILNGMACAAMALGLSWAVLHPGVHDGIVIKAGLILMVVGFGTLALRLLAGLQEGDAIYLSRSVLMVNAGALIVAAGYGLRRARAGGRPRRRSSDFMNLNGRKP